MKLVPILFASLFAAGSVFAGPAAPTAEQVAQWAVFSKPVHLKARKMYPDGHSTPWGSPVWICYYDANDTSTTYTISLYKAGTLFGTNRAKMEKSIANAAVQLAGLARKDPGPESGEVANLIRVETRPDGRKVYFTMIMGAPGSGEYLGFTTVGQYDLLLEQSGDPGEAPHDQNPAKPTKGISEIFKQLEKFISEGE